MKRPQTAAGKLIFLLIALTTLTCPISAQPPSSYYDIAKQRLLAISAAQFITNVTQGEIEEDSAQLFACKIYGFDRSLPYNEDFPDNTSKEAILLNQVIYYLFKPGTEKKDLDSALTYLQQVRILSSQPGKEKWMNVVLSLSGKFYYQAGNPTQGQSYFYQLISTCELQKDQKGLALACENAGKYLPFKDSNRVIYLQRSLDLYQQLGLKEKQIEVLSLITTGHFWTDWPKAIKELQQVLALQTAIRYRHTHFVHYVTSYLNDQTGDELSGLDHCYKALASMTAVNDSTFYPLAYLRMATIYSSADRKDDAIAILEKALNGPKSRETQSFWYPNFLTLLHLLTTNNRFEEALSLIKEIDRNYPPNTLVEKMNLACEKGYCYEHLGQSKLARENFDLFVSLSAGFPPQYISVVIPESYYRVSDFEFKQGDYAKSRLYIEKAKTYAIGRKGAFAQVAIAFMQFRLDSITGNYLTAIKDYINYTDLNDTFHSVTQKRQINELLIKNETDKKDHNIQLLTQQGQFQQSQLHQANLARNVTIAGACLLFIILILLFYQYRTKQSANRIITQKNHSMEVLLREKETLLADKEILVKEIHHRVKNNLHMISSLLESQSAYLQNEALTAIQKSQHRVQAISLIHQKLYVNENITDVLMSVYLREIVSYLRDSFVTDESIIFALDLDPVQLDVSQAVPLGLIVNEAITNSIKYAFPASQKGQIEISLKETRDGQCRLRIADNGIGLSADFNVKKHDSLGMSLIRGLSNTLNAVITINANKGTVIELVFINAHSTQPIS